MAQLPSVPTCLPSDHNLQHLRPLRRCHDHTGVALQPVFAVVAAVCPFHLQGEAPTCHSCATGHRLPGNGLWRSWQVTRSPWSAPKPIPQAILPPGPSVATASPDGGPARCRRSPATAPVRAQRPSQTAGIGPQPMHATTDSRRQFHTRCRALRLSAAWPPTSRLTSMALRPTPGPRVISAASARSMTTSATRLLPSPVGAARRRRQGWRKRERARQS